MRDFLIDSLVELAKVPSAVPTGADTLIAPDAPLLVHYVQKELRRRFVELGAEDIIDLPRNHFAVRFGNGNGPCLALMAYTPTQHHNLMEDPWSGRIRTPVELGINEPCVFGQGMTQNKAHQAILLSVAKRLIDQGTDFDGTLLLCVNNEGRSSHECSDLILDSLSVIPDLIIQLFNSGFDIYRGNRGRVDLYIQVEGEAAHSSSPPDRGLVIPAVTRVLGQLELLDTKVNQIRHPDLGAEQAIPYQVTFEPLAPHTLPSSAKVTVDRRLLPSTDSQTATEELREALDGIDAHGCKVTVEAGPVMLPALLPLDAAPLLAPLERAIQKHLGQEPRHAYYSGSFDAGGPMSRGIPTVMFGVPDEGTIVGEDFVRLSNVRAQERILLDVICDQLAITNLTR